MRQLLICGWIVAFAAVALPLPAPGATAPLRVVTYHFNIDQHGFASETDVALNGTTSLSNASMAHGRSGSLTVDVLEATKDGGLLVEVHEQVDREDRPRQVIKCAIYENPDNVLCDQNLVQAGALTEEVDSLLTYFGRAFYDTSRLDNNNHWQTVQTLSSGTAKRTTDFTVTAAEGNTLTINVNRITRSAGKDVTTHGTLLYDSGMTVPKGGHLVTNSNEGGELGGSIFDFNLLSDSFAKKP